MGYNWKQPDWTKFNYNVDGIENLLLKRVISQ